MIMSSRPLLALALCLAVTGPSLAAAAAAGAPPDFHHTGDAVFKANHWPFTVELFSVSHDMRDLPAERSRKAVVALDTDKQLTLRFLRDMDPERLTGWIRDELEDAGFRDEGRVRAFLGAFGRGSLTRDERAVIQYDADAHVTTVTVGRGAPVQVKGLDFMRAAWGVWFGRKLGDGLVEKL